MWSKILKITLIVLVGALIVVQFIRPNFSNPPVVEAEGDHSMTGRVRIDDTALTPQIPEEQGDLSLGQGEDVGGQALGRRECGDVAVTPVVSHVQWSGQVARDGNP